MISLVHRARTGSARDSRDRKDHDVKISVLGPGCPKCERLYETTRRAIDELGLDAELEKITDIQVIMTFGVMMTPALAVDGEVKVVGKVPGLDEIKALFG